MSLEFEKEKRVTSKVTFLFLNQDNTFSVVQENWKSQSLTITFIVAYIYEFYDNEKDKLVTFFCSCGHLYHSFCLQSKECTTEIEGQTRWTCYKCSSSNKVGKLNENSLEIKKGRITPSEVRPVFGKMNV